MGFDKYHQLAQVFTSCNLCFLDDKDNACYQNKSNIISLVF